MSDWAERRACEIGIRIRILRGKRSGQWLADETKTHGHAISRTTISELENGKRRDITLAELTVLAAALETFPGRLMFASISAEVLPGRCFDSETASRWFSGESDLPADGLLSPNVRVAKAVARFRRNRGLTAEALADHCATLGMPDLNRSVIANIESGRRTYVSVDELCCFAQALGVTPSDLIGRPYVDPTSALPSTERKLPT